MKKKKVYCKKCRWRDDAKSCRIWERIDDHDSPGHKVLAHSFNTTAQNKDNDCEHYLFWFWWWFGNVA